MLYISRDTFQTSIALLAEKCCRFSIKFGNGTRQFINGWYFEKPITITSVSPGWLVCKDDNNEVTYHYFDTNQHIQIYWFIEAILVRYLHDIRRVNSTLFEFNVLIPGETDYHKEVYVPKLDKIRENQMMVDGEYFRMKEIEYNCSEVIRRTIFNTTPKVVDLMTLEIKKDKL
jgi:hypothetical protein